tara:strand:- start:2615 stop:2983 length:369 start_codon:yes stop_codon:yes gene_type:complete
VPNLRIIKKILILVFVFSNIANADQEVTLSCSYIDTFNSENIITFFLKREKDKFKYFFKGKERYTYDILLFSDKKIILGLFNNQFDGIFIFDKVYRTFKMINVPFGTMKQETVFTGKCEEII